MKEFLTGVDGEFSSKRLITLLSFILFMVTWAVDLFTDLALSENIVDSLVWLISVGMGTVVAEKFSKKRTRPSVNVDLSGAPREGIQ